MTTSKKNKISSAKDFDEAFDSGDVKDFLDLKSVKVPNDVTKKVLEDSRRGKNIKSFDSVDDLSKDLDI